MLQSLVIWVKGLSFIGKTVLLLTVVGTPMAFASTQHSNNQPASTTKSEQKTEPSQRSEPVITYREVTEQQDIEFAKRTEETAALVKGVAQLKTAGVLGKKELVYRLTLVDGVQKNKELVGESVAVNPVDEVTLVGTYVEPPQPTCNPNYSGCVPDVDYDLDCADIGYTVRVIGYDEYRLDRDHDGWGCE